MCTVILARELTSSSDAPTRARARGRAITASLAWALSAGYGTSVRDRLARGDRDAWEYHVDPSGGWREPLSRSTAIPPISSTSPAETITLTPRRGR